MGETVDEGHDTRGFRLFAALRRRVALHGDQSRPEPTAEPPDPNAAALAKQAEAPDSVRSALDAAASSSAGLWITFITFGTYLVIAVGSVTHRQLFLEDPITLPLLNVALPLVAFFWLAPILFVIFHAYLLLNLLQLSDRVSRYEGLIRSARLSADQVDKLRSQLPGFVFVQFLMEPLPGRKGLGGHLSKAIALITVVVAPVGLLLFTQIQFLAYHSLWVTWLHRIALICDLALLWLFWARITGSAPRVTLRIAGAVVLTLALAVFSCFLAIFPGERQQENRLTLAWLPVPFWLAQFPPSYSADTIDTDRPLGSFDVSALGNAGVASDTPTRDLQSPAVEVALDTEEIQVLLETLSEDAWADLYARCAALRGTGRTGKFTGTREVIVAVCKAVDGYPRVIAWVSPYTILFAGSVNEVTGTPASLFSNTLVLSDQDFVDDDDLAKIQGLAEKESAQPWEGQRTNSLRGRDLTRAYLVRADLRRSDFTGADLSGAILNDARLEGATFGCAVTGSKRTSSSGCAKLREASLDGAKLQNATLASAELQGASLVGSELQGAELLNAKLQGAKLFSTQLQGASLWGADLLGASLYSAGLQGATLDYADLRAASLYEAQLQGASLSSADLRGASLLGASLEGASFGDAKLQGALIAKAHLWRADGTRAIGTPLLLAPNFDPIFDPVTTVNEWLAQIPQKLDLAAARDRFAVLANEETEGADTEMAAAWKGLDLSARAYDRREAIEDYARQFHDAILSYTCSGDAGVAAAIRGRIFGITLSDLNYPDIWGARATAKDILTCNIANLLDKQTLSILALIADHFIPAGVE